MFLLPIVSRELRVAARRKSVYRLRMAVGALTLGLGALFVWRQNALDYANAAAGRTLFVWLTGLLSLGALAPVYLTHDCLSSEKREGTLGLLFLTDLAPHDIVLGKLFAGALPSFYALMAAFPLLAATILTGGVTGTQLWQTSVALLNLYFFAESVAVFASALSRRATAAAAGAGTIVGVFLVGFGALDVVTHHRYWMAQAFNPAWPVALAADLGGAMHCAGAFPLALANVHLTAWMFLAGASLALPRTWREKAGRSSVAVARPAARARMPRVDDDPFFWLAARRMGQPGTIWTALGVTAALSLLAASLFPRLMPWPMIGALALLHGLLKYWAASVAGGAMEEHRRTGSLEILLACAPLPASAVLEGQSRAFWRLFLGPMAALAGLDLAVAFFSNNGALQACCLGAIVSLPMDLSTFGSLAPWFAMSQKKAGRAAVTAYFWVCAFPGLLLLLPFAPANGGDANCIPEFVVWVAFGLFLDGILLSTSRDNLPPQLRAMAASSADQSRPFSLFSEPPGFYRGCGAHMAGRG